MAKPGGDLWIGVAGAIKQFNVTHSIWRTLPKADFDWMSFFATDSGHLVESGGTQRVECDIVIQDKFDRNAPTNDLHQTYMTVSLAERNRLNQILRTNGNHRYISRDSARFLGPKGVLAIQNLHDRQWKYLEDTDGFPNPPTILELDGDNLWVGGEGAIALVSLKENKVKKFCHIKTNSVDRIQIAGGYVWVQFDWHLYRVPLSALQ